MSCPPQDAIVLGKARLISSWICEDRVFESESQAQHAWPLRLDGVLIPAGNAAIPKKR